MENSNILKSARKENIIKFQSERHRLNDRLQYLIICQLFVAPLFFGSNRPAFWLLWSCILSMIAAWWLFMMGVTGSRLNIAAWDIRVVITPFSLLTVYMLFQVVPINLIVPELSLALSNSENLPIGTISLAPGDTVLAMVRWISYGLLFFLTVQFSANTSRATRLIRLLFWCIVIHALLGLTLLFQFNDTILGIPKWDHFGSATGGFTNRNSFATVLAFGSILGAVQIIQSFKQRFSATIQYIPTSSLYFTMIAILPIFIGWLIIVSALLATNSRMGIFAACIGVLCCVLLDTNNLGSRLRRKAISIYIGCIFSLGVPLTYLYGTQYLKRLGQLESGDINYRMTLYRQVKKMIQARPFSGFGGDSFEYAFPLFHQPNMDIDRISQKTHSTYLALWADYGIIFGSLPLFIVGYLFCKIFNEYLNRDYSDPVLLAAIGVIIVGTLHSLVDFSLEVEAVTFIFVAVIACGYAQTFVKISKLKP